MKVGTKSLLWGVHQIFWHPLTVTLAWRELYKKWPSWKEFVCIFIHDWDIGDAQIWMGKKEKDIQSGRQI